MGVVRDAEGAAFWALELEECVRRLETNAHTGLSEEEASARLGMFGGNTIGKTEDKTWLAILGAQFKSPLILVLVGAGIVTLFLEHARDAAFIFSAVFVNTLLGFYQEFKAERALDELKTYLRARARVIRGGAEREVDAASLVPGDLVRIAAGDRVPADARLLYANGLYADEAVLTGEALPETKSADAVPKDASLGDQTSMVFAGTLITEGVGTALTCRTGAGTELGKIAQLVGSVGREETPLQKAIRVFSVRATFALAAVSVLLFVVGVVLGYSVTDMFVTAVAVAVAAIPEGLPIALTVILAVGVERMAKRNAVVRRLVAAESLGSATVLLSDKTGTLTEANMTLSGLLPSEGCTDDQLLRYAILNADPVVENPEDAPEEWRMSGKMMEVALVRASAHRGMQALEEKRRTDILQSKPFNERDKFSVSLVREGGQHTLVFVGAPDVLLRHAQTSGADTRAVAGEMSALAAGGARLLGVAVEEVAPEKDFSLANVAPGKATRFLGLVSFEDPVRETAPGAIARLHASGVRVVVVTGDHIGTAQAVMRSVGLSGEALEAHELTQMSEEELVRRLPRLALVARVTPSDKVRIVQALQRSGEIVAMTGDGVNDAPSIKQADVGVAMGSGTDVSRSVADLVLLDNDLGTLAVAVQEGRQIMRNIRKTLVYLLSTVVDALLLIGGALLLGLPLPVSALQILWINFFSDSFPAVGFAFERDKGEDRSVPTSTRLFDPLARFLIIGIGALSSALLLVLYVVLLRAGVDLDTTRTFVFACLGSYTLFAALAVKSLDASIFSYPLFSNRYLAGGIGIGFILMFAAVYVPPLQALFGTVPLNAPWLFGVLVVGIMNMAAIEYGKWLFRRGRLNGSYPYEPLKT